MPKSTDSLQRKTSGTKISRGREANNFILSERLKQIEKHRDTNDENEKLNEILLCIKDIQIPYRFRLKNVKAGRKQQLQG